MQHLIFLKVHNLDGLMADYAVQKKKMSEVEDIAASKFRKILKSQKQRKLSFNLFVLHKMFAKVEYAERR